jgi:alanyl-tRNA synthetase
MNRRYYTDSYTSVFTARVVEATTLEDRPAVVLDDTFFYPTSGGQPHDTGLLGGVPVFEVRLRESDGAVLHRLEGTLSEGPVQGIIDWSRRLDHMQQHTGQHILSAAFVKVAEAPTIGFHLGEEYVSIDLGVRELDETRAVEAEELANAVVRTDLQVRAWFPSADELATIPLRKTPDVEGDLRVVAIGEFDHSACGGTHVARTGEVGPIKLLRTERLSRGVRVSFLAGDRARADYARKHAIVRSLAGSLTCAPEEVAEAVARLEHALQESRRETALWRAAALDGEAAEMISRAETSGAVRVVVAGFEERAADALRELALKITEREDLIALLGTTGAKTQLVFARSENVARDLRPLLDRALAELGGGRGGGARVVQGGAGPVARARLDAALQSARTLLGAG